MIDPRTTYLRSAYRIDERPERRDDMLSRDQLEQAYLAQVTAAHTHLDDVRRNTNPVTKGMHIAQALVAAQLAVAAATALAKAAPVWSTVEPHEILGGQDTDRHGNSR